MSTKSHIVCLQMKVYSYQYILHQSIDIVVSVNIFDDWDDLHNSTTCVPYALLHSRYRLCSSLIRYYIITLDLPNYNRVISAIGKLLIQ